MSTIGAVAPSVITKLFRSLVAILWSLVNLTLLGNAIAHSPQNVHFAKLMATGFAVIASVGQQFIKAASSTFSVDISGRPRKGAAKVAFVTSGINCFP